MVLSARDMGDAVIRGLSARDGVVLLSEDYQLGIGGGVVIRGLSTRDWRWCCYLSEHCED